MRGEELISFSAIHFKKNDSPLHYSLLITKTKLK